MKRLGIILAALSLVGAADAVHYVRSRVNNSQSATAHCLWWPEGNLHYTQSTLGNPPTVDVFGAVTRSFTTWQTQLNACGNLKLIEDAPSPARFVGYHSDGTPNQNLVIFRTKTCADVAAPADPCHAAGTCNNQYDCWPEEYAGGIIALTTNTYDTHSGRLYDSDIELNAASFYFTTADGPVCQDIALSQSCSAFDVQNTITHETGHLLGLAHDSEPGSTMFAQAPQGETTKRLLDPGSLQFICDAYPKGFTTKDCVGLDGVDGMSCGATVAPGAPASAALLLLAGLRRRRRP